MHMLHCVLHSLTHLSIHSPIDSAPRLCTRQWLPRTKCTNHFLPRLALGFLLASLKSSWDWIWVVQRLTSQDKLSSQEVGIVGWADHRERVLSPVCFWGSPVDLSTAWFLGSIVEDSDFADLGCDSGILILQSSLIQSLMWLPLLSPDSLSRDSGLRNTLHWASIYYLGSWLVTLDLIWC